jgi:hypothetical protein
VDDFGVCDRLAPGVVSGQTGRRGLLLPQVFRASHSQRTDVAEVPLLPLMIARRGNCSAI